MPYAEPNLTIERTLSPANAPVWLLRCFGSQRAPASEGTLGIVSRSRAPWRAAVSEIAG